MVKCTFMSDPSSFMAAFAQTLREVRSAGWALQIRQMAIGGPVVGGPSFLENGSRLANVMCLTKRRRMDYVSQLLVRNVS